MINSRWQDLLQAWLGLPDRHVHSFSERRRHFLWLWQISLPFLICLAGWHYFVVQLEQLAWLEFLLAVFVLMPARTLITDTSYLIWAEFMALGVAMSLSWAYTLYAGNQTAAWLWALSFPFLSYWLCGQFRGHCWNLAWLSGLLLLSSIADLLPWTFKPVSHAVWPGLAAALFYTGIAALTNFQRLQNQAQAAPNLSASIKHDIRPGTQVSVLHDPLTGLPNRLQLQDMLQQEIEAASGREQGLLVIHIRLQRMFELTSLLGPQASDELVQRLVRTMQASVGSRGCFARIRRDEFVCLYRNHRSQLENWAVIREMLTFQLDYREQNFAIPIQHQCGVAVYPLHAETADLLLRQAELAMLHAQFSNQDFAIYEVSFETQMQRRHQLFGQLHQALNQGGLSLHYQGQVDLHSGHLIGAEALARWFDSTQGTTPPLEFIPVAEKSGLIKPLTLWVLRQGLSDLARWHHEGLDISLSVNISARSITDAELVDAIYALLSEFSIPPRKLILELTEASFSDAPELARQTMLALANLGVQISIDDFGTGYSSLSYLKDLPVNELKIDQSFVRGLLLDHSCRAIVQSTIQLAHNLNLRVVAEGIENPRTEIQLRELGCDFGQGYWYGKAMSAEVFQQWVGNQQTRPNNALFS